MQDKEIPFRKYYRLRMAQKSKKNSFEVTFPFEVVDREARKHNLSLEEFIKKFQVVANFNGFEGVLYIFEEIIPKAGDSEIGQQKSG